MTPHSRHTRALEGLPLPEIRWVLANDTRAGRDLAQKSPFAGMLNEPERSGILEPLTAIVSPTLSRAVKMARAVGSEFWQGHLVERASKSVTESLK